MFDLKEYGWTGEGGFPGDSLPGRITECRRERYRLVCRHGEIPAEIKGSFYHAAGAGGDFPAVGDFVTFEHNPRGNSLITGVLPRRSCLSRADFSGHGAGFVKNIREQVIAANFDYGAVLSSLNRDFNVNRIARYVTAIWQSGALPLALLTKADLSEDPGGRAAELRRVLRDVPVITLSSMTGEGLSGLAPFLEPGKTVVFLGSSGVGKSSLLNVLAGSPLMAEGAIREDDGRGRHTTTHRQLFRLPGGALVIDTPGMRELGLFDSGEGLARTFADLEELAGRCRFTDCRHETEPGCAVRAALEEGAVLPEEWRNYLAQKRELAFTEDHSAYLREKREFHKALARRNRSRPRRGDS